MKALLLGWLILVAGSTHAMDPAYEPDLGKSVRYYSSGQKIGAKLLRDLKAPDGYTVRLGEKDSGITGRSEGYYFPSLAVAIRYPVMNYDPSTGLVAFSGVETKFGKTRRGDWNEVKALPEVSNDVWGELESNPIAGDFEALYQKVGKNSRDKIEVFLVVCVHYGMRGHLVMCEQVPTTDLERRVLTLQHPTSKEKFTLEIDASRSIR